MVQPISHNKTHFFLAIFSFFQSLFECPTELLLDKVFATIIDVQSKATLSDEFREHCNSATESGKIPVEAVHFWCFGERREDDDLNISFMSHAKGVLERHLSSPDHKHIAVNTPELKSLLRDLTAQLKGKETLWDGVDEAKNHGKFRDYFTGAKSQATNTFHALFVRMGFCKETYKRDGKFHLYLHCQPPANNRDCTKSFLVEHKGHYCHTMFEYATNDKVSLESKDTIMNVSEGHYIIVEALKAKDVADQQLRSRASPYTHMWKHQDSLDSKFSRLDGQKIQGDPIACSPALESYQALFQLFTVSSIPTIMWICLP